MGCAGSKLDDLPAVALCRDRGAHLDAAVRLRYSLADSYVSYLRSLRSVGESLQSFFDSGGGAGAAPPSPVLPLPARGKFVDRDPLPDLPPPTATAHVHSHSHSGSHLQFNSDSDSGSAMSSPFHDEHRDFVNEPREFHPQQQHQETQYYFNYMRSQPPPASVSYEQRPPVAGYVGEPSSSSSPPAPYGYGYAYQARSSAYAYPYGYAPKYGGAEFFGSPPQGYYPSAASPPMVQPGRASDEASSSRVPPPPPSPPKASTWDFLNPFETFERFYTASAPYTPSRDSREVREEEGIPDLEDEEEVVKEVNVEQNFVLDGGVGGYTKAGPPPSMVNDERRISGEAGGGMKYEVHMVDKNVVRNVEPPVAEEPRGSVSAAFKAARGSLGASEVLREIRAQFERAAESGAEVAKMLEAGKLPYHRRNAVHKASWKMINVMTPTLPVASPSSAAEKDNSLFLDFMEDKAMKAGNLSATMEKLYIWENKLYAEVKAEERLRVILERKCRRLKYLEERGAEAHKIDATRTYIQKLSTKIRIAIQVVETIANKISKLRDEELWLEISELIQGLVIMWQAMLECHRNQGQIISEGKNLDAMASEGNLGESRMDATRRLEYDILNWISSFHSWISLQKGYVKALNDWLLKCIKHEPEITPDGIAPFSPGRMGAPPVFVICNQWAQMIERISEHEVFETMQSFAATILQICNRHHMEQRQRLMANKDMDKRVKELEGEDQRLQKTIDAVNKKLVIVSEESGVLLPGQIVHQLHDDIDGSLQISLKHLFGAMEKFSADSMKAYDELRVRSEEHKVTRENAKVP